MLGVPAFSVKTAVNCTEWKIISSVFLFFQDISFVSAGFLYGNHCISFLSLWLFLQDPLYRKKVQYEAVEAAQEEELQAQMDRSEELKQYEEYTNSREYKEYIARTKLGQVYPNWIIFREND